MAIDTYGESNMVHLKEGVSIRLLRLGHCLHITTSNHQRLVFLLFFSPCPSPPVIIKFLNSYSIVYSIYMLFIRSTLFLNSTTETNIRIY